MDKVIILFLFIFFNNSYSQNENKKLLPIDLKIELNSITFNDQKYRSYISENKKYLRKTEIDSLWNLQQIEDIKNTNRVLEIIEEYGYLTSINADTNFPMHIILMHTPKHLIDRVYEVIDKEMKNGRIIESSYGMITWHLDGRKEIKLEQFLKKNDSIDKQ